MAKKSALVISAHAADFVWRCGGAIALHEKLGYEVTIVCLSFGERGESGNLWKRGKSLEEIKTIRRCEAENAASVLEANDIQFYDLGDYPLVIDQDAATTVTGLYAAGENATGIHGAGRLSGNGLTSSVVMGRVAGKKAAAHSDSEVSHTTNYIDQNIQETIKITKKDSNSLEAIKLKIREAAESGLGVIRNEKDLKAAMDTFAAMEKKLQKLNLENPTTFEIWQMTRLASMMASAALEKQMNHFGQ